MECPDGQKSHDPKVIADRFNDEFCSHFSSDLPNTTSAMDICTNDAYIDNVIFSASEIYECLQKLPNSTSSDPDDLCYVAIKKAGHFISGKLAHIFQQSMSHATIPDSWRHVTITPIYKSGYKLIYSNYRPIAAFSNSSMITISC